MNNKFDELTKGLAQSVTRRAALRKLGVGLAGMALACFGLANKAGAATYSGYCQVGGHPFLPGARYTGMCVDLNRCIAASSVDCPAWGTLVKGNVLQGDACSTLYKKQKPCSFTS